MSETHRNAVRAILTRAADADAARQRALQDGDRERAAAYESELRKLWRQHADLERRSGHVT